MRRRRSTSARCRVYGSVPRRSAAASRRDDGVLPKLAATSEAAGGAGVVLGVGGRGVVDLEVGATLSDRLPADLGRVPRLRAVRPVCRSGLRQGLPAEADRVRAWTEPAGGLGMERRLPVELGTATGRGTSRTAATLPGHTETAGVLHSARGSVGLCETPVGRPTDRQRRVRPALLPVGLVPEPVNSTPQGIRIHPKLAFGKRRIKLLNPVEYSHFIRSTFLLIEKTYALDMTVGKIRLDNSRAS